MDAIQPHGSGVAAIARALGRRPQRPRPAAVLAAIALHVALLSGFWYSSRMLSRQLPEFRTFRVNLVSPPPQIQGEPLPVLEAPSIVTPPPAVTPPTPPVQQQTPPVERTPPVPPTVAPPVRQPAQTQGNNPLPVPVGGDGVNVQMEGADFPFPGYLENVIRQINNHFRWTGAPTLETQVHFYILRDGSVGGIQVVRGSGNVAFDLEATGAVEQAGRRGTFGALPEGWQPDRLWISFRFLPPR